MPATFYELLHRADAMCQQRNEVAELITEQLLQMSAEARSQNAELIESIEFARRDYERQEPLWRSVEAALGDEVVDVRQACADLASIIDILDAQIDLFGVILRQIKAGSAPKN